MIIIKVFVVNHYGDVRIFRSEDAVLTYFQDQYPKKKRLRLYECYEGIYQVLNHNQDIFGRDWENEVTIAKATLE